MCSYRDQTSGETALLLVEHLAESGGRAHATAMATRKREPTVIHRDERWCARVPVKRPMLPSIPLLSGWWPIAMRETGETTNLTGSLLTTLNSQRLPERREMQLTLS